MTNTNTNKESQAKAYRYEVTISGKGGDFWFIPMTAEQFAFWEQKGNEALTEHLNGAFDEDDASEVRLGHYVDLRDQAGGIEPGLDGELIVRGEGGETHLKAYLCDVDTIENVVIDHDVVEPSCGGFFRTYEKSKWTYELELTEQFDPSKLRLRATGLPGQVLIKGIFYAGAEISRTSYPGNLL